VAKVVKHVALDERELENLIPIDVLRKIASVDEMRLLLQPALDRNGALWDYLDIKNGVRLDWIEKQDEPTQSYWKGVRDLIERRMKRCSICDVGRDEEDECACSYVKGLGDRLLNDSVKLINANDAKMNLRLMESDIRWEKLGKMVFDFAVAFGGEMVASA
jgi:hypothetical protein